MRLLFILIALTITLPAHAQIVPNATDVIPDGQSAPVELKPELPTPLSQSLPETIKEQADKIAPQKREPVPMPQPDGKKWQSGAEEGWVKKTICFPYRQTKRAWNGSKYIAHEMKDFYNDPRGTAKRWEGDGTLAFGQVIGTAAGVLAGVSTTIFAAGR